MEGAAIKDTVRMFIALELPPALLSGLEAFSAALQKEVKAHFTRAENYHVTLVFLGDTPLSLVPQIGRVMEEAAQGRTPVGAALDGGGFFGKPQNAVLWCGLTGAQPLIELSKRIRAGLEDAGIPFDPKPMKPHITLARKADLSRIDLKQYTPVPAKAELKTLALFSSERIDGVLAYTPIFTVTLQ